MPFLICFSNAEVAEDAGTVLMIEIILLESSEFP